MNMSSSVHLAQPSPANLVRSNGSAPDTARPTRPRPQRWIRFIDLFCHYYDLRTDRKVALSALGRRNLAWRIWRTYTESQKVAWRDSAKDAAERHGDIFPGYTFQPTTRNDIEREKKLEERDARERKARELRKAREDLRKAAESRAQSKEGSTARRSSKHTSRYAPYTRLSKPAQPSDGPTTGNKHTVPSTSAHVMGRPHYRAPHRVISPEDAALERMLQGLSLSAGDM